MEAKVDFLDCAGLSFDWVSFKYDRKFPMKAKRAQWRSATSLHGARSAPSLPRLGDFSLVCLESRYD